MKRFKVTKLKAIAQGRLWAKSAEEGAGQGQDQGYYDEGYYD